MAITTITNAMVSVNAIQGTLIADNAITAVHIATNAVSGTLIADNAITATHIAQNVITVTQLADDAVEADKIADGVITTNHLNKAMISSQTEVAVATGDFILLGDTSDSNNLKKAPISSILAGTLTTAAQTNITSLGTLTGLTGGTGDLVWDTNTLVVDSSANKVGIGTASPLGKLSVGDGSINDPGLPVQISTDADDSQIWYAANRNGGYGALFGYSASATYKGLVLRNVVSAGTSNADGISFMTNNTSMRMHIAGDGNVGIGTTDFNNMGSSSYKGLKVGGATLQDSGGGNGSATHFLNNAYVGSGNNFYFDGGGAASGMQLTSGDVNFFTFDGSGGSADAQWSTVSRLHVAQNGRVGINTTDPDAMLEIVHSDPRIRLRDDTAGGGAGNGGQIEFTGYHAGASDGKREFARIKGLKENSVGGNMDGYLAFLTNDGNLEDRMRITSNGDVGIGTTSPSAMLHIYSTTSGAAKLRLDISGGGSDVWDLYSTTAGRIYVTNPNYSGGVYLQHTHTAWTGNSDENLKENITSLGTVGDKLKNYRTSYFNWKSDTSETPRKQIGFIAQDWEDDFPEVVNRVEGEPLGMQYTETIPILLKYIQELEARIETLEG